MGEPGNQLDEATESEDKTVALLIAVLALLLALSETGAKNAEHHATDKNIESSDLYNFYQAKKLRQSLAETAAQSFEAVAPMVSDEKAKVGIEAQAAAWKKRAADFEHDPKNPNDSLERIQERAKEAAENRERANRKLDHFEISSAALQISIVLASAAIITGVVLLAWISGVLGLVGAVLMGFGYLAPDVLSFLG